VNLGAVLLTGLFAGGVSCAAVQGGLLTGLVTRQRNSPPAGQTGAKPAGSRRAPAGTPPARANAAMAGQPKGGQSKAGGWTARTVEPPKPWYQRAWGGLRAARATLADDITPVGAFLSGKLASHTLLGALLGLIGGAVQLSPTIRAWTQLAAGALVIAFGLAQLGVGPFKRFTVQPPAAWARFVRGRARSQAAFAPAVLGFVTVLLPCGITLSMEALALTTGSAWQGAAVMAVFVLGTSPLFAAFGYAARKAATAWRGRLATLTGLIVLTMGVYTLNGGLTLIDSPLAATNLAQTLGFSAGPPDASTVTLTGSRQQAVITARPGSYSPANIAVTAGVPTTLVMHSINNDGCTRALVISGREYVLPENGDARIDLGVLRPGTLHYRCGMGMYSGQLTVTDPTTTSR
jgi:sulfite exporter TauE/SafE